MTPDLSVVLVIGAQRERGERALVSLLREVEDGPDALRVEILLLDCAAGAQALPPSGHSAVKLVRLPASVRFSEARRIGVERAQAPVVAFLEEHCTVAPGWARALVEAHRGPWAAVGAEVHNGNPGRWSSRLVAMMNYHPWEPPASRGEFSMLPGHNVSFKRDVLLAYGGERLEAMFRPELILQARLRLDGHAMLLEPNAKFFHFNDPGWWTCARGFFLFHRLYGPGRAAEFGWGPARRAFYVVATPAIPFYFVARFLLVNLFRKPSLVPRALLGMPFLLWTQSASACGQAYGLLFGARNAEVRFTDYELNTARPEDNVLPRSA
jgi:hypothetical protein